MTVASEETAGRGMTRLPPSLLLHSIPKQVSSGMAGTGLQLTTTPWLPKVMAKPAMAKVMAKATIQYVAERAAHMAMAWRTGGGSS